MLNTLAARAHSKGLELVNALIETVPFDDDISMLAVEIPES